MNNVANPPDPLNPTGQIVKLVTRDRANENQVRTLLTIVQTLNPYLLASTDTISGGGYGVDKEAEDSACATFMTVCNRLDTMLADASRWSIKDSEDVVESICATQAAIQAYYAEQSQTVKALRAPHRIFKPQFAKMGEAFTAYYASSDFPGGILIGQGGTPEAALADFDEAFNRLPAEQLKFNEGSLAKIAAAGFTVAPVEEPAPEPEVKAKKKSPRRKK